MSINTDYNLGVYKLPQFVSNGKTIDIDSETLIQLGSGGLDYYLAPDLAVDASGGLHCVYANGNAHNSEDSFIAYRKSTSVTSEGVVWGSQVTLVPAIDSTITTNPSICVTNTGRILVHYGFHTTGLRQVWMLHSDDGGNNWSAVRRMTEDYALNQITGPCSPIVLEDNTILKSFYATNEVPGGAREGVIYRSTDNGDTFTYYTTMYPNSSGNLEEPSLIRRSDNLFISLARSDPHDSTFMLCSQNGKNWSWRQEAYPSIGKNPLAISPNGTIITLGRYSVAGADLKRSIFAYSNDGGKTWVWDFLIADLSRYMYAGVVWHSGIGKFISVVSVEVDGSTPFVGPTKLMNIIFNEV